MMCHSSKPVAFVLNFKGWAMIVVRHVSQKVRSESILYHRLVLIDQCYS